MTIPVIFSGGPANGKKNWLEDRHDHAFIVYPGSAFEETDESNAIVFRANYVRTDCLFKDTGCVIFEFTGMTRGAM